ncbi:MAG: tRNA 5-methoxyuridine(34)/uridine 5-oxyacetic acid(34) synthase CmoB [Pseudomonadota bacterium]
MTDYSPLLEGLKDSPLSAWADALAQQLPDNLSVARYGDLPRWQQALADLPELDIANVDLDGRFITLTAKNALHDGAKIALKQALMKFHPWRKGPFDIAGVTIDTEWRSDLKWRRLIEHIEPLSGRTVLDVGCGSGYHCWRMAGAGAALTIGIEPSPLFVMQYWALQRYIRNPRVWVVPQRMEQVPVNLKAFDTVFSMGILYHRRSPFEHLQALRDSLRPGGQLVLETLVIDESEGDCLVPEKRYAKMGNVWFIPSVRSLQTWLRKMRFKDVAISDVSVTTSEEQRSTEWMRFESLQDFLDAKDTSKTIEGYPAPRRAVLTATAP